jgi:hypothetical protein
MVRKKTVTKAKPQFLVAINLQNVGLDNQIYSFPTKKGAKDFFDHAVSEGYQCFISVNPVKLKVK